MLAPACNATAPRAAVVYVHGEKNPLRNAAAVPTETLMKGIARVHARLACIQVAISPGRVAPTGTDTIFGSSINAACVAASWRHGVHFGLFLQLLPSLFRRQQGSDQWLD